MEAIVERCCGLDVHQATVVACLLVGRPDERPKKTLRKFDTTTSGLTELCQWLAAAGCTQVGMESTGVYWKPVYVILEGTFELVVGNAHHIKNVAGRKTDIKDAEWIADLLRHGLIPRSFVPPPDIRELRDLVRFRRRLVSDRTTARNRISKLLETANVKLSSVLSNVFGVSGMAMLRGLVSGQQSNGEMAALARGHLRKKLPDIERAIDGRMGAHHRLLLKLQLERLDELDRHVGQLDVEIERRLEPYRESSEKIMTLPGIGAVNAARVIAEIGTDMSVFRSDKHLASWTAICPGNYESAGKRQRGTIRQGNVYLKTTLVEAAQAAVKKKGTYFREKFRRLMPRLGYKRAIVAIAHKLLIAIYHLLRDNVPYRDLGEGYLDSLDQRRTTKRLVSHLQRLGYQVALTKGDPAPAG